MNRTLWKLDRIGERLWILATMTATHAVSLANDGKGIAVVADETRIMANKINNAVEKVIVDGEKLKNHEIKELAFQLQFLALNSAIESSRIVGQMGKKAAIYADEIRNLAHEIVCLFDEESAVRRKSTASPWAANPSSTARNSEFMLLNAGGINIVEPLVNIKEVCYISEPGENSITLRNLELPRINAYKMLGEKPETQTHVILWTPWAEQNKTYAVTADVSHLFASPIGKPITPPSDMPLAKYVRECWENENGEPFYFMDWPEMAVL